MNVRALGDLPRVPELRKGVARLWTQFFFCHNTCQGFKEGQTLLYEWYS